MKQFLCFFIYQFFSTELIALPISGDIDKAKSFQSKISWAFEENKGQVTGADSSKVKFFYKQNGVTMFILNTGIVYQFEKMHFPAGYKRPNKFALKNELDSFHELSKQVKIETYRMDIELIGANPNPEIIKEGESPDYIQYYNHNALGVHAYQKIIYKNIYPNIDWVIYLNSKSTSDQGLLTNDFVKYDFIVNPGGTPTDIKLKSKWAENIKIDADGSLVFKTSMGSITDNAPISFQENISIQTQFKLNDSLISFQISDYDKSKTLTIDPNIVWSTYYGGSQYEIGYSCKVDNSGNIYLAGETGSTTNIFSGGHQNSLVGSLDAFLAKFNTSGTRLWATYYGGNNSEWYIFCTTDNIGNVFLSGISESSNNIASSGHQNTYGGGTYDAFLVKFNSSGTRLWGTYYGGTLNDLAFSCSADKLNNIYLTGSSSSTSNIASGGHQNTYGGGLYGDAYLVKFNSSGTRLWATYYGGNNCGDNGYSCCTDTFGNVYMTGSTFCPSDIASGGHQNTFGGPMYSGWTDAFLVKFNSSGTRLWGTYYGGLNYDYGTACATDISGNIYITGTTLSDTGIAFAGHQNSRDSLFDVFLVKFNSTGSRIWGTYYGGKSSEEYSAYCIIDNFGDVILSGTTESKNNIAINGWKDTLTGSYDAFLVKFNSLGIRKWGSYFGGSGSESEFYSQCTKDNFGNIYLAGTTNSTSNISLNGFQNSYGGSQDAFLVKIQDNPYITIYKNKPDTICLGTSILFFDTITNGGTLPKFKWYVNNILVDTNASFSTSNLNHGDSIKCLLKSSETGLSVDSAWSNTIRIYFYSLSSKTIYDTICSNKTKLFNSVYLSTTGVYLDTLVSSKGCDSFLTLNLLVKPISSKTIYDTICSNKTKLFNSVYLSTTGVYLDTLVSSKSCDSFLTLNLYVKQISTNTIFDTICINQPKLFNGINLTTSGTYLDTLVNSIGCDSFLILNLFVKQISTSSIFDTICVNQPRLFNGVNLTSSGIYYDTFINKNGCDSFLTLYLFVKQISSNTIFDTICSNHPKLFNGSGLTSSGIYLDTLINSQGCDSLLTLNLTVNQTSIGHRYDSICPNLGIIFNGISYYTNGNYFDTLVNSKGCDSFLTMHLYVKQSSSKTINETICFGQSRFFNENNLTINGTYLDTLINSQGCDSFLTLNLTVNVNSTVTTNIYDTICSNRTYLFNSQLLNTSGIYKDTFTSSSGCDSFVFLHLYVKPFSFSSYNHTTTCTNPSYFFNNQTLTQSGAYKDTFIAANGCDSIVTVFLTVKGNTSFNLPPVSLCPGQSYFFNGQNRTTAGTYTQTLTNSVGCDSIITLTLNYLTTPTGVNNIIWACNPYMFKGKTYISNAIVIDTVKSSFGCDSLYRFNYIYLKSKPDSVYKYFTVCDSVTIKNIVHKTSFSYSDTMRTTQNIVCDSLYQITNYTIKYTPTITLSTKQEDTFFKGENIIISANNIKNYRWSTGETKRDISFKLTQNESIFLIAWNDPECQDTAYTNITALDETILEFPTGFSPSSKKPENQIFRPNIVGKIERIQLEIFNRLGEKVYSSNNLASLGWDGTYKDAASPQGVYTYLIEYVTNKRIFFKSGEVELVR